MTYDHTRALELLRLGSGNVMADFREDQEAAIRHVVEGAGRLLVVQKTGWGKSFVYFIATRLLRDRGAGPALLVSPLLALMRNQVLAAERMGLRAATLNSENRDEWDAITARLHSNDIDILLISPEQLGNEYFTAEILAPIASDIALMVIDEAHCISDWGHDFRPHYRLLERVVKRLPQNLRLLATTATANDRVMQDLTAVLGPGMRVMRGDLNRSSLTLQTLQMPDKASRLAWLARQLHTLPGHGIIYTLTIDDANQVAAWLRLQGFAVDAYTGKSGEHRPALEQALQDNKVKALVATTALGMGYDKPDLSFVIHYQMPGSVVAYYQQAGRAGRALESAYGVLLSGDEQEATLDWFIRSAFPSRDEVTLILAALESAPEGLSVPDLMARVNLGKGRIEKTITALSLESPAPIARQQTRWQLTSALLRPEFWSRAERLTALRYQELQQMRTYVAQPFGSHMAFLIDALDGNSDMLMPPRLPALPSDIDTTLLQRAQAFLNRTCLPIAPRLKWPVGGMPRFGIHNASSISHVAQAGKALCMLNDAGLGRLVQEGKYADHHFPDRLVAACVEMLQDWSPHPAPTWVTCVPSPRRPDLMPDFAMRVAHALGLPFSVVIAESHERPEQKTMANSTQQARNLDGAFTITGLPLSNGPVLLLDDIVDSRWTLTVAAWLLRRSGSGLVWPMVLAKTGHGG
ncbi:DEAD/DEAH box helicase [Stenotrophomonas sp. CFBP 13718]|uniref:DEAD/DEAH box helicase n=1 Tax=Stenotrophomonas sp. CFBP 13718 TaxID=2775304 RepID=UPI0017871849|nr:DEAD/DEAH box helicase [Stenotrophomonas sp. CFBP 13718]MBD8696231.1 RecQ family ATP-dependent DNA helicase [Stenotrophomonas sp. CFBP 13718]